ncbi:hypothetical protein ACQP1W_25220 [Spirillospora sp. CA-255316]
MTTSPASKYQPDDPGACPAAITTLSATAHNTTTASMLASRLVALPTTTRTAPP